MSTSLSMMTALLYSPRSLCQFLEFCFHTL